MWLLLLCCCVVFDITIAIVTVDVVLAAADEVRLREVQQAELEGWA